MFRKTAIVMGAALLAGSFLAAGTVMAEDDYDVRAYGPKHTIVWNTPVKASFSHKVHTADIGLECSACHGEIFAMQRGVASATHRFNMAAMAEGKFCGACHDGDTAFATDSNCSACHEPPEKLIVWTVPVKAVVFDHNKHTNEYGLDCESCHNSAFVMKRGVAEKSPDSFTMEAIYNGQYCGVCHDGDTAFAANTRCNTCHIGVKGYNRMVGGGSSNGHGGEHGGH